MITANINIESIYNSNIIIVYINNYKCSISRHSELICDNYGNPCYTYIAYNSIFSIEINNSINFECIDNNYYTNIDINTENFYNY